MDFYNAVEGKLENPSESHECLPQLPRAAPCHDISLPFFTAKYNTNDAQMLIKRISSSQQWSSMCSHILHDNHQTDFTPPCEDAPLSVVWA